MDIVGDPVRMVSGVQQNSTFGDLAYDISDTGTLIYIRGESSAAVFPPRKMAWAHRNGTMETISQERDAYYFPRLSPDGSTVAITRFSQSSGGDIWTIGLDDGKARRLTIDEGNELRPIWSKDGSKIIYSSTANGGGFRVREADGTGDVIIISDDGDQRAETLTADGKSLVYRTYENRVPNMKIAPLNESGPAKPLISAPYNVAFSAISPDGNWIAYTSDETSEYQVYVRPFPNTEDGKEMISINGGEEPRWSADGTELFFRTVDEIWSVSVPPQTGTTFSAGAPELLLSGEFLSYGQRPSYDVSPDGQKFLVFMDAGEVEEQPKSTIAVVTNWFEELERVLP
jgi:Tol biopolymer transport system component